MTFPQPVELDQRIFIVSFPKSGTHLAEQMISAIAHKSTSKGWLGTFCHNGWSTQWTPGSNKWPEYVPLFPAGGYLKGHTGYRTDIAEALLTSGVSTLFVFRDLRDVVVSQAYHATSDRLSLNHPGYPLFKQMDSFEDVLVAVIKGIGIYAGLIERWELYAPWLQENWILPIRFEDMRYHAPQTARMMLRYVIGFTAIHAGYEQIPITSAYINRMAMQMVERSRRRKRSTTFRKGQSGGWHKHFSKRVREAFVDVGGADWLIKLGYEDNYQWLIQQ